MSAAGMSVVHGSPQSVWMPVVPATKIYVGGLVCVDTSGPLAGIIMLPDASGVANDSNLDVPLGVCIGTNRKNPLFDSTELTEYILSPAAGDAFGGASIEYVGVEGPWAKGDPIPMVKVALIDPSSVIKAPLRVANIKTAPSVLAVTSQTTGGATGVGFTGDTQDFASIANDMSTIYFRTGGNAGTYRLNNSASNTAALFAKATRNSIEEGDTFVSAPLRSHGYSTVMFDDATAMFIDCGDAPVLNGTDRWIINVLRLDLATPGQEYAEFRFDPVHFNHYSV